jgi:hypothetical protein
MRAPERYGMDDRSYHGPFQDMRAVGLVVRLVMKQASGSKLDVFRSIAEPLHFVTPLTGINLTVQKRVLHAL